VRVTFQGTSAGEAWSNVAEEVRVESATELRIRVPEFLGNPNIPGIADGAVSRVSFPACNILIQNLDNNGNPITGETVTASAAYTYIQPLLGLPGGDPPILLVTRALLHTLKRQIIGRAATIAHTDYALDGATVTAVSDLPMLDVSLEIAKDPFFCQYDSEQTYVRDGSAWIEYEPSMTVLLAARIDMAAEFDHQMQRMIDACFELSIRTPWLTVQTPLAHETHITASNRYPLEWDALPRQQGRPSRINLHSYFANCTVRGIPIISSDSIRRVFPRTTVRMTQTDLSLSQPVTL